MTVTTLANHVGHASRAAATGRTNASGPRSVPALTTSTAFRAGGNAQPMPSDGPLTTSVELHLLLEHAVRGLADTVDALRTTLRRLELEEERTHLGAAQLAVGSVGIAARFRDPGAPAALTRVPGSGASRGARAVDRAVIQVLPDERRVWRGSEEIQLSRLEFDLLLFFVEHPRLVFNRGQLLESVWGYTHAGRRTVDVYIRRLRAKLADIAPLLTTVRGVGYRFNGGTEITVVRRQVAA